MRFKKIFIICTIIILILPSLLVSADMEEGMQKEELKEESGEFSSKDEVIYGTLSATGKSEEMYIVNTFDVKKTGKMIDYGSYESVKNLTDLSEIKQQGNKVEFSAPKGKFYYQGNLNNASLPWNIDISYLLDGKEISPENLPGKNGHIQIQIETSQNKEVDDVFFENYLLQISLTLTPEVFSNIKAEDGMIANAGKNKQVTFTVMPEKEEKLLLEADVNHFELDGIDITAVPSFMSIDAPDTDEMTGDMKSLTDAIAEINNGVFELKNGVSEFSNGVTNLSDGSSQYKTGLSELNGGSSEIVSASESIKNALSTMNSSLSEGMEDVDLSQLEDLQTGLGEIASGMTEAADGILEFAKAYKTLGEAIENIPSADLTDEEIQNLLASDADTEVVQKLLKTYEEAAKVKGTFSALKTELEKNEVSLEGLSESIRTIGKSVQTMADGFNDSLEKMDVNDSFTQLREGINTLSSSYKEFHSGLIEYTNGVSQIASSYNELHNGIVELSGGANELASGVSELHNGTDELYQSTNNLPNQMKEEIDEMIAQYDKSDFEAISYTSAKNNEKINTVQFILKTDSIKLEEPEKTEEPEEEELSLWDRIINLFS